jgi:hypothetical protein
MAKKSFCGVSHRGNKVDVSGSGFFTDLSDTVIDGNAIVDPGYSFISRYTTSTAHQGHLSWDHVQLGNNGQNYIVAGGGGGTGTGGSLGFVVNNTNELTGLYAYTYKTGTVAMFIASDSNVGIGTTSPNSLLHLVGGQLRLTNASVTDRAAELNLTGTRTTAGFGLIVANTATSSTSSINKYGVFIDTTGTWNGSSSSAYDIYAATPSALNYFAGNVGIGTTSPNSLLHLVGGQLRLTNASVTDRAAELSLTGTRTTAGFG